MPALYHTYPKTTNYFSSYEGDNPALKDSEGSSSKNKTFLHKKYRVHLIYFLTGSEEDIKMDDVLVSSWMGIIFQRGKGPKIHRRRVPWKKEGMEDCSYRSAA
jgi:hypothetical protein